MMQWIRLLVWLLAAISALPAVGGEFENLGIPVTTAGVRAFATGPGPDGRRTMLYISYNQYGAPFFLMQIDPDTGIARQFNAPRGSSDGANLGSWACYGASDGKMYLGTYNGGNLLSFDPKHPENGIRLIGRPSSTESYIWEVTEGPDGKIYGCTYPQAKLVSYDPATDKMADLGRLDPVEMYSRRITTGKNGWIYIAIGPVKAQIVAYNTSTKEKRSLIPEAQRPEGFASVYYNAIDGHAYGSAGGISYRLLNGAMTQVSASSIPSMPHAGDRPLEDGRWFVSAGTTGTYTIRNPAAGTSYTGSFTYEGAGSMVFVVGDGPDGCVYGSSILPLNMFAYDPVRRTSTNLGNPTDSGG